MKVKIRYREIMDTYIVRQCLSTHLYGEKSCSFVDESFSSERNTYSLREHYLPWGRSRSPYGAHDSKDDSKSSHRTFYERTDSFKVDRQPVKGRSLVGKGTYYLQE